MINNYKRCYLYSLLLDTNNYNLELLPGYSLWILDPRIQLQAVGTAVKAEGESSAEIKEEVE